MGLFLSVGMLFQLVILAALWGQHFQTQWKACAPSSKARTLVHPEFLPVNSRFQKPQGFAFPFPTVRISDLPKCFFFSALHHNVQTCLGDIAWLQTSTIK